MCSLEKHIDERDNLHVAEDAADRFGVHNDEIGVPNLDAQELELTVYIFSFGLNIRNHQYFYIYRKFKKVNFVCKIIYSIRIFPQLFNISLFLHLG